MPNGFATSRPGFAKRYESTALLILLILFPQLLFEDRVCLIFSGFAQLPRYDVIIFSAFMTPRLIFLRSFAAALRPITGSGFLLCAARFCLFFGLLIRFGLIRISA